MRALAERGRETETEIERGIESEKGEGQGRRRRGLQTRYPHHLVMLFHSALKKQSEYAPGVLQ